MGPKVTINGASSRWKKRKMASEYRWRLRICETAIANGRQGVVCYIGDWMQVNKKKAKKDMNMLQTINTGPPTCQGFVNKVTELWIQKKRLLEWPRERNRNITHNFEYAGPSGHAV